MHFLAAFVLFLCLQRQGGDGARAEAFERNRFAGFLAISVCALVDPAKRGVDLCDQLALAVTGPQFQRAVGFGRCAVGDIGNILGFFLHVDEGLAALAQDRAFPGGKLLAEEFLLPGAHELLAFGRHILNVDRYFDIHLICPSHTSPQQKPPVLSGVSIDNLWQLVTT